VTSHSRCSRSRIVRLVRLLGSWTGGEGRRLPGSFDSNSRAKTMPLPDVTLNRPLAGSSTPRASVSSSSVRHDAPYCTQMRNECGGSPVCSAVRRRRRGMRRLKAAVRSWFTYTTGEMPCWVAYCHDRRTGSKGPRGTFWASSTWTT